MGVGPRDIRIIRTDSLQNMGVPASTDQVLIRDVTDNVVKVANVEDVGITDHGLLSGLADFTSDHGTSHDAHDHSTALGTASTSDLPEGTNLYYTSGRFDTAFAGKSTSDLSEGTNLYYTDARVNADIDVRVDKAFVDALGVNADTLDGEQATAFADAVHTHTEGDITNLDHLTIEEVQDNLGTSFIVGGTDITVTYDDVANTLTFSKDALVAADIPNLDTSKITTGTFDDARIAQSNVTQHEAALTVTESQISNLDHLTIEEVQDNLGTTFIVAGTDISLSYDDVANTLTVNNTAPAITDHGALTGLTDDDHTHYSLASGARAFTGTVAGVDPTADAHLATKAYIDSRQPTGSVQMFAGSSAPSGWLLCDGSAVSRTTYSELYAVVGDTFGAGDGSTTFNLPDLRTRFPVGAQAGGDYDLGDIGGEATHTLTEAEMPSHTHSGPSHNHSGPSHNHTVNPPATNTNNDTHGHTIQAALNPDVGTPIERIEAGQQPSGGNVNNATNTVNNDTHNHTVNIGSFSSGNAGTGTTGNAGTGNTSSAGSGSAHENRPPFLAVNFIIRT